MNDLELLQDFRRSGSEAAFQALVQRHLGMVRSVALKRVRNPDWADEVAHAVFIALARKADALPEGVILVGWLYRATRFAAANLLRNEERRTRHEREAALILMNDSWPANQPAPWREWAPHLFQELDRLSIRDREAILLRFMNNCSFSEVASAMGVSEAAAKMRTGRALEKLRRRLGKLGLGLTIAALSSELEAGPAGQSMLQLVASVSSSALRQPADSSQAGFLADGILRAMRWARLKVLLIGWSAVTSAIAMAFVLWQASGHKAIAVSPTEIVQRKGWNVLGRDPQLVTHEGQSGIQFGPAAGRGLVWRDGLSFSEGVVEVDVAAAAGHMGLAFWVRDAEHYSAVYFRPQNQLPDPINGLHGVQYIAMPDYGWERLRRDLNGLYENAITLPSPESGHWFHIRLEIRARKVRVWVDQATEPCLIVQDPLTSDTSGSVGLYMGNGSRGTFANLKMVPSR